MDAIAILCDKGPFGTNSANEAIRLGSGFLALGEEIRCKVIFYGDAVLFLKKGLDATAIGIESIDDGLEMADLTDMPLVLVTEDLTERGLTKEDVIEYSNLEFITRAEMVNVLLDFPAAFKI